jgi:hypothetical protein
MLSKAFKVIARKGQIIGIPTFALFTLESYHIPERGTSPFRKRPGKTGPRDGKASLVRGLGISDLGEGPEHLHGLDVEIDGTALDISSLAIVSR